MGDDRADRLRSHRYVTSVEDMDIEELQRRIRRADARIDRLRMERRRLQDELQERTSDD